MGVYYGGYYGILGVWTVAHMSLVLGNCLASTQGTVLEQRPPCFGSQKVTALREPEV